MRSTGTRFARPDAKALSRFFKIAEQHADRSAVNALRRMWRRQQRLEILVSRALVENRQLRWRMRLGAPLATAGSLDQVIDYAAGKRKSAYAVGLGRWSRIKSGRTHADYVALGRKGATVRWQRVRAEL